MVSKSTSPQMDTRLLIPAGGHHLRGDLVVPEMSIGLVIFAHGSGSSRLSPRNKYVAEVLNKAGLATLLIDLLSEEEEQFDNKTAKLRFDVQMLGDRLVEIIDWAVVNDDTKGLKIGLFGASTGAAAAILAAARREKWVPAVVSRGGRPDLATDALTVLPAATLLIVGGRDPDVLDMNREALALLTCPKQLEIVPGATHLFEESGALDRVAMLAQGWFTKHLR